jgi:hypothetical protein
MFLGLASKLGSTVSAGLTSKPMASGFLVCTQNRQLQFGELVLKITATVSWFGPQNQVGCGLSVALPNRWGNEDGAGYASRSSGLFHVEVSWAKFSQSGLKTVEGATWMMHVASSRRLRRDQAEDECVGVMDCIESCYPCFAVFFVLSLRGVLVF